MSIYLPVTWLLVQTAILVLARPIAAPAAYWAMVGAPLLTGVAAAWRARREASAARLGWSAVALALGIWALGAFGNLWQELVLGHADEMYRSAMLAFNLSTVPLAFLLATEWRPGGGRPLVRAIDFALALALGYEYFLVTWTMISARAAPEEAGVAYLVWLIDAQNLYIALGALVRWGVAEDPGERDLFRALSAYSVIFLALVFVNDHYFAGDPAIGPEWGCIVTVAFALLAGLALGAPSSRPVRPVRAGLARGVQTACPIVLCGALLVVSLFLIRVDYVLGCAGILAAAIGHGLRSTLTQVRHIERGDVLQQQRSELQQIAQTDALTGVANRYRLDEELRNACRGAGTPGETVSLLMIDIDHFKLLNDQLGHVVGDSCLRSVAHALQQTLKRPGDLLARYGGEEFVALLRGVDGDGARIVAERLCAAVRDLAIRNEGSPFGRVTVSVGAATTIINGASEPKRLIEAADRALYEAKCAGRDQARGPVLAA